METHDFNGAVSKALSDAISQNIMAVSSAKLLNQILNEKTPEAHDVQARLADESRWSRFINTQQDFVVLIPNQYVKTAYELGFNTDSLKQVEYQALHSYLKQEKAQADISVDNFVHLFNPNLPIHQKHPKRIWLIGHGKEKDGPKTAFDLLFSANEALMCGLRLNDMAQILAFFNRINTEFLYVASCHSFGDNLIRLRNKELLCDDAVEWPLNQARYPITFQASSDSSTMIQEGTHYFKEFFAVLNEFLVNRRRFKLQCHPTILLKQALSELFKTRPLAVNIPSVCMPGGRFRSINCPHVYCIDQGMLAHHRTRIDQPIVIPQDTQFLTISPCDLSNSTIQLSGPMVPYFISKIPGNSQHIIGTIQVPDISIENFIDKSFDRSALGEATTFNRTLIDF